MRELSEFSLERLVNADTHWPTTTRLLRHGRWTGCEVPGSWLERQYQLDDGYLILTSDDCPFEEATYFTRLDAALRPLGSESLIAPYSSYLLERATPCAPRQLEVTFGNGERWLLTLPPSTSKGPPLRLERQPDP